MVHLIILIGGIFVPEYFLFPLGLFYMAFGVVRATILGLMERPEPAGVAVERLADGSERDPLAPVTRERREVWGDRRQKPEV